jgi:hypothetical protein
MLTWNGWRGNAVSKERTGSNFELLGVVSYGHGCGRAGIPGVYTKITAIHPWLVGILREKNQLANSPPKGTRPDRYRHNLFFILSSTERIFLLMSFVNPFCSLAADYYLSNFNV